MSALSAARNTKEISPLASFTGPVAADVKCYGGGIAVRDSSGNLKPAETATGLVVMGRFEDTADNTDGLAAAITASYKPGIYRWANSSSADEITKAEIGDNCYVVDDQTVAKTSGGATRSVMGKIVDVDDVGVWVETGVAITLAPGGALLAASNLSDLGSAATARTNLGVNVGMGTPAFVIGAESGGNVINVAIQLKDVAGSDLAVRGTLLAYFSDDANGDSVTGTAFDTVAIGTDGVAIPLIAGKTYLLTSESDGDIDLNITEDGTPTKYLILVLPNGRLVASGAITFA